MHEIEIIRDFCFIHNEYGGGIFSIGNTYIIQTEIQIFDSQVFFSNE